MKTATVRSSPPSFLSLPREEGREREPSAGTREGVERPPKLVKHKPGYTLVEMMMVVSIMGILATVGPTMMVQLQNFYLMTTARNEIERDARNSLDVMNRFIRGAVDSTIVIDTPSGQGPYSRISFAGVDGRSYQFYQSGGNLKMTINGDTTTLSKNMIYIAFTFPQSDNPTIVSVSLTMGKNIQLGKKKVLELTIQKVRVMN